jgi:transposase
MSTGRKACADESARRINAAVELLAVGLSVPEAARQLGLQHRISERQARRYIDRARQMGAVEIPEPKLVFTVKLSGALVGRVRGYAQVRQRTLSSIVAQALEEFLGGRAGPHSG